MHYARDTTMNLPNEFENRRIAWATSQHKGKNKNLRVLIGGKSRAGGVMRRNHFTATEPTSLPRLVGERPTGMVYQVKIKGITRGAYKLRSQVEAIAHATGGYVSMA